MKEQWLMTIRDHLEMRKLYPGLVRGALASSVVVRKIADDKRNMFGNLIVANYEVRNGVQDVS